jgi:valyl-tRNA synthetase
VFSPTSLLIPGFDILVFWVARMIMLGCWFMAPPEKPGSTDGRVGTGALAGPSAQSAAETGEQSSPAFVGGAQDKLPWRSGNTESSSHPEDALRDSVPFREVYIHALVRDAERQKMSKTKGNVLDPIQVIEKYGTDATRFTLAAMSSPGTDIAFNESRTEGYRAFANKIWNAARFMFMNMERLDLHGSDILIPTGSSGSRPERTGVDARSQRDIADLQGIPGFRVATLEDWWSLSRFNSVAQSVNESLEAYRFDQAASAIYDFFWGDFCDWYIELIKPRLAPECAENARIACANLVRLFEASLRLLHPVMPFITDEIWHAIYEGNPPQRSLALAAYPLADGKQVDKAAETQMAILQDLIVSVRNLRAELKVETKAKLPIEVFVHEADIRRLIEENRNALERLANVEGLGFAGSSLEKMANTRHTARFDVRLIYERKIDVAAEREKTKKELDQADRELGNIDRQLANEQFIAKAPAHVVEKMRNRKQELVVLRDKLRKKLDEFGVKIVQRLKPQ